MNAAFLEKYLSEGIQNLVKEALRGVYSNPKGAAFFLQYGLAAKKAESLRLNAARNGEHIPPFLVASITNRCNLNCKGCYDRARDGAKELGEMTRAEWGRVFREAQELGVSAIMLAGGEPLLRNDVLEEAALYPSILFPVFTNGTLLGTFHTALFEKHRQLIPVISIEGGHVSTDARRGEGVYAQTMLAMKKLKELDLLFGVSITVTNKNLHEVTSDEAALDLETKGCKLIVFVEYVPFTQPDLALNDDGRRLLEERINHLRNTKNIIIISFPGDERETGGCLAAGRGFFHINANGNAEPCPFSPHSDTSLKTTPLRKALSSPLFVKLRSDGSLQKEHSGGCVLFDQADYVKSLQMVKHL
jgi:MoaA/NifB/PqqE/SkfB family radical SAM enzyme